LKVVRRRGQGSIPAPCRIRSVRRMAAASGKVLVVDNSDRRQAGKWFANCLEGFGCVRVKNREELDPHDLGYPAVVLSGSERSIFENAEWLDKQLSYVRTLAKEGVPLLGVCFGHQLVFRSLYGKEVLTRRAAPEVGWVTVNLNGDEIFEGLGDSIRPYNFHFDEVGDVPDGWRIIASSAACRVHAVRHDELPIYGLQFHPETTVEDGVSSISCRSRVLAEYGVDAASITAASSRGERHYPEIIRNFVAFCGPRPRPK
jgi:GMP synthase (glutamine-hydrolysing)